MALDEKTCLLLLDLQNDLVHEEGKFGSQGLAGIVSGRGVLENAARALAAARDAGVPVGHVRVAFRADDADVISRHPRVAHLRGVGAMTDGAWGGAIHDAVAPRDGEPVFTKQSVNPFVSTNLANWLHRHGITRVVMGGVATNQVVEATMRHCDDIGLLPVALEDCCASPKPDLHDFAIQNIFPMFGTVTTTAEFVANL